MKKLPLSYIEINKKSLIYNCQQFRNFVKKGTQISAVIKSNAYGHGSLEVVKILNPFVDYFQVNSFRELEAIKKISKKPILVLGYVSKNDLAKAISAGCILSAFDFEHLLLINEAARKLNKKQKIHLAIDSFLGREGFMPSEISKILPEIKKMKNVTVDGIYSHFANIEDTANFSHAQKQINIYQKICILFKNNNYKNIKTHISATSGALVYEQDNGFNNIVRIGIGIYGLWPSLYLEKNWKNKINLKPILRFVTHVAQIKTLTKGYSVGYGLTYVTKKETRVAVIPVGYADGFDRSLSNIGEVLIKGIKCRVLGRVAMNMFVVDVSNIPDLNTEEEVIIIGKQGQGEISVEEIAKKANTINYEIIAQLNPLIPRIIV
ncbi:MAG: alanine racemase [bacterium]